MTHPWRSGQRGPTSMVVLALISVLAPLVGCGLPSDNEPRAITEEALPVGLQGSETVAAPPTGRTENIFVIQTDNTDPDGEKKRLAPFAVSVSDDPRTVDLLNALVDAQPGTVDDSLSTAIPPEIEFDLTFDGTTAIISLSEEIADAQGQAQRLALAQMVFTATELETVQAVEFRIDGEPLDVVTDDGRSQERVDRNDFDQFAPVPD